MKLRKKPTKLYPRGTPIEVRFWEGVRRGGPLECWPWTRGTDQRGYGVVQRLRTQPGVRVGQIKAHRFAWELTYGPIPPGPFHGTWGVLHKCDNPPCCNPSHLYLGTATDNSRDLLLRTKHRPFGRNQDGGSKLTLAAVAEIRARLARRETHQSIANIFGVSKQVITAINRRKIWNNRWGFGAAAD